jgi:hypothetical protein
MTDAAVKQARATHEITDAVLCQVVQETTKPQFSKVVDHIEAKRPTDYSQVLFKNTDRVVAMNSEIDTDQSGLPPKKQRRLALKTDAAGQP